jgi:type I restriction enzyme, R subunit
MYVLPKLKSNGWTDEMIREQMQITAGRIIPQGRSGKRLTPKKPDYTLFYAPNFKIAVVEAKSIYKTAGHGIQQAIEYAKILDLKFAYSTNGVKIEEYDFITKQQTTINKFPKPEELWNRLNKYLKLDDKDKNALLKPFNRDSKSLDGKVIEPRYYQEIAINAAMTAILHGKRRILLTLATGTGKTFIAFQLAKKLWDTNSPHPKILFLADRDILITQAFFGNFEPFGEARHRIQKTVQKAYEMYFALYQALDVDQDQGELYKEYSEDFFDYIIIDECHRGSANESSNWRHILNHFKKAIHIGMTATPKRDADSLDTYDYFGTPIYTYSLRQGIEDGFLSPYFVVRPILDIDINGYEPKLGELDIEGKPLEQRKYTVSDFDRILTIEERRKRVSIHLTEFLEKNNQKYDKTILFCQNSEHAAGMTKLLRNYSGEGPDYCVRIVSAEGDIAREYLDKFTNPKEDFPVIAVTSRLMSTGVDAPTCRIIALDKVINSMTEFKQIIGRGTRVFEPKDKLWFTIIDYRGASRLFEDEEWDGPAEAITEEELEEITKEKERKIMETANKQAENKLDSNLNSDHITESRETYIIQGITVEVIGESVKIFDQTMGKPRLISYQDYTGETVRRLVNDFEMNLNQIWIDPEKRNHFILELERRGITLHHLQEIIRNYNADPFDILLHFGYNSQLKTRIQRAENVKKRKIFFQKYPEKAREVLEVILQHYAEIGPQELNDREVLRLEKFKKFGGDYVIINNIFKGADKYDHAIIEIVKAIYS